jgi:hypothetical protein
MADATCAPPLFSSTLVIAIACSSAGCNLTVSGVDGLPARGAPSGNSRTSHKCVATDAQQASTNRRGHLRAGAAKKE